MTLKQYLLENYDDDPGIKDLKSLLGEIEKIDGLEEWDKNIDKQEGRIEMSLAVEGIHHRTIWKYIYVSKFKDWSDDYDISITEYHPYLYSRNLALTFDMEKVERDRVMSFFESLALKDQKEILAPELQEQYDMRVKNLAAEEGVEILGYFPFMSAELQREMIDGHGKRAVTHILNLDPELRKQYSGIASLNETIQAIFYGE